MLMIYVVPARAGVIPNFLKTTMTRTSGTRASGGDPDLEEKQRPEWLWYPRERG